MFTCGMLLVILIAWRLSCVHAEEYFTCSGQGNRISETELCNGHVDCSSDDSDSSDESVAFCLPRKCKDDEYRCAYGACIPLALKCDGNFDCADHSDETRFLCINNTMDALQQMRGDCFEEDEVQCISGDCIEFTSLCDGVVDCEDSSDESVAMCAHIDCPPYSYRCGYGGCIQHSLRCNGIVNCADASDELEHICGRKRKQQANIALRSVRPLVAKLEKTVPFDDTCAIPYSSPLLRITYENRELPLQLNERVPLNMNVSFECMENTLLRGPTSLVCKDNDWYKEWPRCESSFEIDVRYGPVECSDTEWKCAHGDICINIAELCNGVKDCLDGSDETVKQCIVQECAQPEQYRCAYGACIARSAVCNDKIDCTDGSDETPLLCVDHEEQYQQRLQGDCDDPLLMACESGECIDQELLCDGLPHCADGSDESVKFCAHIVCPPFVFRCGYGACVTSNALCNNIEECADGSDELEVACNATRTATLATTERANADGYEDFYDFHIDEFEAKNDLYNVSDYDDFNEEDQIDDDNIFAARAMPVPKSTMVLSSAMVYRKCFIPLDRLHLRAEVGTETLRAGSDVEPETIVWYSCDSRWWLTDGRDCGLCMQNGEWSSPPPRCERKCDTATLQVGISTTADCYYHNSRTDCNGTVLVGTSAKLQCNYGYSPEFSNIDGSNNTTNTTTISCDDDGEWNAPKLKCYPDCAEVNAMNGKNAPYNASIFHRSDDTVRASWNFGCFATILSPKFVITGALCFSINPTPSSVANDPELYNVCIGRCNNAYDDMENEDNALRQVHKISEILIADSVVDTIDVPALVVVSDYILLKMSVMPICLDFDAYNCKAKQPNTWAKQPSLNDTVNILGVDQQCLVFVGETSLVVLDYFKHWLQTQLSRYDHLL